MNFIDAFEQAHKTMMDNCVTAECFVTDMMCSLESHEWKELEEIIADFTYMQHQDFSGRPMSAEERKEYRDRLERLFWHLGGLYTANLDLNLQLNGYYDEKRGIAS